MGEIADLIINGEQCSWCGINFMAEHGYPVLCNDCFDEEIKKGETDKTILKKYALQRTLEDEI